MRKDQRTTTAEPSEADIQNAAYHIWVKNGCPSGQDVDNWFEAKELLRHHHGRFGGRTRRAAIAKTAAIPARNETANLSISHSP